MGKFVCYNIIAICIIILIWSLRSFLSANTSSYSVVPACIFHSIIIKIFNYNLSIFTVRIRCIQISLKEFSSYPGVSLKDIIAYSFLFSGTQYIKSAFRLSFIFFLVFVMVETFEKIS